MKVVHPLVSFLREEMKRQNVTVDVMVKRSGVSRRVFFQWSTPSYKFTPSLSNIEACLAVLGYKLKPEKIDDKSG